MTNHYETLGVGRDADSDTLTAVHDSLVAQHKDDAAALEQIEEAYQVLSGPRRRMYDIFLARQEQKAAAPVAPPVDTVPEVPPAPPAPAPVFEAPVEPPVAKVDVVEPAPAPPEEKIDLATSLITSAVIEIAPEEPKPTPTSLNFVFGGLDLSKMQPTAPKHTDSKPGKTGGKFDQIKERIKKLKP